MNDHENIRARVALMASGDLDPDEVRRVRAHLEGCDVCRSAGEDFVAIAGAVRGLPTPQPRPELVAQVRALAARRLARRDEAAAGNPVVAALVAAGWIMAVLTWPLLCDAARWFAGAWPLGGDGIAEAVVAFSIPGSVMVSVATLIVCGRLRILGRAR